MSETASLYLSERVGAIGPSATLAASERANQLRAQGVDVLDLGPGQPDFEIAGSELRQNNPRSRGSAALLTGEFPSDVRVSATMRRLEGGGDGAIEIGRCRERRVQVGSRNVCHCSGDV